MISVIHEPLRLIQELWSTRDTGNEVFNEKETFAQLLSDPNIHKHIPSIQGDREHCRNGQLASYRGIIRHTFGIEMYAGTYEETDHLLSVTRLMTTKYREEVMPSNEHCSIHVEASSLCPGATLERVPIVCGPVPGVSKWVENTSPLSRTTSNILHSSSTLKRQVQDSCAGTAGFVDDLLPFRSSHFD